MGTTTSNSNGNESDYGYEEEEDIITSFQEEGSVIHVRYNEQLSKNGWPGKKVIEIVIGEDMLPLTYIRVSCLGKDQGWGNTGFSKICLFVLNQEGELKYQKNVGIVVHNEHPLSLDIDKTDIPHQNIEIGDRIGVWAISAPYGGYECFCKNASLTIGITRHWKRRKHFLMFLYHFGFQFLNGQPVIPPKNVGYSNALEQVFENMDLNREIAKCL